MMSCLALLVLSAFCVLTPRCVLKNLNTFVVLRIPSRANVSNMFALFGMILSRTNVFAIVIKLRGAK